MLSSVSISTQDLPAVFREDFSEDIQTTGWIVNGSLNSAVRWDMDSSPGGVNSYMSWPSSLNYNDDDNYSNTNAAIVMMTNGISDSHWGDVTSPTIDTMGADFLEIHFWCRFNMYSNENPPDGDVRQFIILHEGRKYATITFDNTPNQNPLEVDIPIGGTGNQSITVSCGQDPDQWHEHIIIVDEALGNINVVFYFSADTQWNLGEGWFIDDLEIRSHKQNPFDPESGVESGLPYACYITSLQSSRSFFLLLLLLLFFFLEYLETHQVIEISETDSFRHNHDKGKCG
jgi:hypothetical protein